MIGLEILDQLVPAIYGSCIRTQFRFVFCFPTLFIDPFLNDFFVPNDFYSFLVSVKVHSLETFRMERSKGVLVSMVIWRAQNLAGNAALSYKAEVAFWWSGLRSLAVVEFIEMLVENVSNGFRL